MNRRNKKLIPDDRTVDVDDPYALEFWSQEFKVSQAKINAAVNAAGTSAPDVKRQLKK
ncbi:DUF3606 domain-containing protein [Mucilaginibacter conchicola]|uniref:DUF3606 domain-containing protein n=1 Tax=Mucilaginibacter conchicola TaxID=2303333 RepID=A0A372NMB6_9SPHI|nr:DUF3606 domain-containing protein [Mucilaginibacter conchicola]RFZ90086.1 DUF3606 domain-containing protein [Mucilaginibacter conchicola]